jgi:hypothetical protein
LELAMLKDLVRYRRVKNPYIIVRRSKARHHGYRANLDNIRDLSKNTPRPRKGREGSTSNGIGKGRSLSSIARGVVGSYVSLGIQRHLSCIGRRLKVRKALRPRSSLHIIGMHILTTMLIGRTLISGSHLRILKISSLGALANTCLGIRR